MDALNKLILEIYRAAKETPVDEFQELALALVRNQIHFRTAAWGTGEITEAGGLVAHTMHLHNEPPEMLDDWASINSHDTVIDEAFANPNRALTFHAPCWFSSSDHALMLDYSRRYGHLNNMIINTISNSHPQGQWLSLYRNDKHDHWEQNDAHFLEQVMPHLIEALEMNRLLGQAHFPATADFMAQADFRLAGTRALARLDGTLYHCGKKFAEFLREVWPEWKSGKLPAELIKTLSFEGEALLAGHAISSVNHGNLLLLNIRKLSPLHGLTRRELEVARLYGVGKSHKEIGLLLDLSPVTVRNFLSRIYTKLDIGNKVELAALFNFG